MAMPSAILLVVLGAVLRFGITAELDGIDLDVIGNILMIGGAVGFLMALVYQLTHRGPADPIDPAAPAAAPPQPGREADQAGRTPVGR